MRKAILFPVIILLTAASVMAQALPQAQPARDSTPPASATLHPALFLVGDSIMKTGTGTGETGPWGWGSEIGSFFDPTKIHVYNEAHGGRSSRSFIEEGLWTNILDRIQPGDFVIIQFGHNDSANSKNYPDRATITGGGEETIELGVGPAKKVVHTYGWYLRQYVADAKAKDATVIICSPIPRNSWIDGKIKRGFDGYAQWAADAAKASGALFIDLNDIAADHYDALGQETAATYFNDYQHTKKIGAQLNAESVIDGLDRLPACPLRKDLVSIPPAAGSAK